MKRIAALIFGIAAVLLGGLWRVQGLGLVRIEPIACVADCKTLEGPSLMWAAIGLVVLLAGAAALFYAAKRRAA